ncbi:MAG: phage minor capsid protein [Clostridia bacterium]
MWRYGLEEKQAEEMLKEVKEENKETEMLKPDYLENCSKDIIEKYAELERRIIKDIARRMAGADFQMTESARCKSNNS